MDMDGDDLLEANEVLKEENERLKVEIALVEDYLDNLKVPKKNDEGLTYRLVGRVSWLQRKGNCIG